VNPFTFELRHWILAAGVGLVSASPSVWGGFGWELALGTVCFGLAGIAIGVLNEMVVNALDYAPSNNLAEESNKSTKNPVA
jgi:hypothetical protein